MNFIIFFFCWEAAPPTTTTSTSRTPHNSLQSAVVVPGDAVASCEVSNPASVCADASCGGDLAAYTATLGKSLCQAVATGGCGGVGGEMTSCQCLLFSSLTGSTAAWAVGTQLGIPESDICLCLARNVMPLLNDSSTDTLLIAAPICAVLEATPAAGPVRSPAAPPSSPSASTAAARLVEVVEAVAAGRPVDPGVAALLEADVAGEQQAQARQAQQAHQRQQARRSKASGRV